MSATMPNGGLEVTISKGRLIISLPLYPEPRPSATGKTLVVASTHGNTPTSVLINDRPVVVGVNAYIKP